MGDERGQQHGEHDALEGAGVAHSGVHEREHERRREQREREQSEQPELGGHGHGQVVRREPAPLVQRLGGREPVAADARARDRVLAEHVEPALDQGRATGRERVRIIAEQVARAGKRKRRERHDGHDGEGHERCSPPRDRREHGQPGAQGEHARLRVAREQPCLPERDRRDAHCARARRRAQHDDAARNQDREREEAAVQARVPEQRIGAEERRVGVRDHDLRVAPDRLGRDLVQADHREHRRESEQRAGEDAQEVAAQFQAAHVRNQRAEREVERDHREGAELEVGRPGKAGAGDHDVDRERGPDPGQARPAPPAAQRLNRHRRHAGPDRGVQRQQVVERRRRRLERQPQPGDERDQWHQPGQPQRDPGTGHEPERRPEHGQDGQRGRVGQAVGQRGQEVEAEWQGARAEQGGARDAHPVVARAQEQRHAERADQRGVRGELAQAHRGALPYRICTSPRSTVVSLPARSYAYSVRV